MINPVLLSILEEEQRELNSKIVKLHSFINHKVYQTLSKTQRTLLDRQLAAMRNYNDIVKLRIIDLRD